MKPLPTPNLNDIEHSVTRGQRKLFFKELLCVKPISNLRPFELLKIE